VNAPATKSPAPTASTGKTCGEAIFRISLAVMTRVHATTGDDHLLATGDGACTLRLGGMR